MVREAVFYARREEKKVKCLLCPHGCVISPGKNGICRVRKNMSGRLVSLNYGKVTALALDPVEKKPLYHFFPGRNILSLGSLGCNFSCGFCQNYHIAHGEPALYEIFPDELLSLALEEQSRDSVGVAFTYNEPLIWYEYIMDTAEKLKSHGLKTVLVTNGYINKEAFKKLLPLIDALNIDIKAFNEEFYRRHCRGDLKTVLDNVELAASCAHVEVTSLLIPRENDAREEIKGLAAFLARISPFIPLHFSRYYPAYKFTLPPTPEEILHQARDTAREYLHFVYLGNLPGEENDTVCLKCQNLLIRRRIYQVFPVGIRDGRCSFCGEELSYIVM
ncbi:pyruvate formate lyase activating enzyme [Thermosyntropha lipolytica DSM 11003]|uniref:Pyruvate formate lyase activating enzyme n=1 Tax=Thermosyntropha lipolytica DSM 11003 TaxID=1123382 RepID=A0A1M5ME85_9FIRM|nr:AmmeMemoRadiSam system radical SAM enzyme [Thermosyntropha lipolytica]SHG75507.1 pyruvate formate lyase activating enzyme [Thermosyntropha lipolytica DSM 11003]